MRELSNECFSRFQRLDSPPPGDSVSTETSPTTNERTNARREKAHPLPGSAGADTLSCPLMAPPPALLFSDSKASGWFFMAERAQESFVYVIEPKKRNRTVWMEWRHGRTRNGVAATVCNGLMFCRTKIFGLVVPPRIRRALANILVHARYGRRCAGPRGARQAAESKRQPRACRAPQDRETHGSISNLSLSRL